MDLYIHQHQVGKTSIARVLAGLWPCFEGIVKKPRAGDIMYLPQRPYLSLGSLRDQLSVFEAFFEFQITDTLILKTIVGSFIPTAFLSFKRWGARMKNW